MLFTIVIYKYVCQFYLDKILHIYIYYQEVVWAGGEDELVRPDGPVLTGQGDVRQALRLVQGVEHLEHDILQFGNVEIWYLY